MIERYPANINYRALAWSREASGMSIEIAARRIGVSTSRLERFESGDVKPTTNQLINIGRAYKRPAAFFYRQALPEMPERLKDFRMMPDIEGEESPPLLLAIRRARERRLDAIELAASLRQDISAFPLSSTMRQSAEILAQDVRAAVGVSLDQQLSWHDQYEALREWIRAVEKLGILVSQFSDVDVSEARGFSLGDQPLPLVALNGKDAPVARIFTLFHELTHVILSNTGLCDLHEYDADQSSVEIFCNRVAAEVLVPEESLLHRVTDRAEGTDEWDYTELRELASAFRVSREVILRRLLTLGFTSEAYYRQKRAEMIAEYQSRTSTGGGFLPYYRRVLRDNGIAFTSLAISAYRDEVISSLELSRLLGDIKLQHIPSIERSLESID